MKEQPTKGKTQMIETGTMEMNVACNICNNSTTLAVNPVDVIQWQQGKLIQDVMPYLNAAERELLISNTCDKCFNDLFPCSDDTDTVRWEEGKEF
tara:strand:+ start:1975 stop:2259 length:285 start_codon:yes stop_codon:yes gene_type:complete